MAARMLRLPLRAGAALRARPVVRPLARPVVLRAPSLGMLSVRGAGRPFSDAAAWASSADGSAAQAELLAKYKPAIDSMLARMPGGRCPYPPGDGPGMPGFDAGGHYVGRGSNGIYEQYVRKHRG